MRGELGPWAQTVAKYQMEQKVKQIIEKYKLSAEQMSGQQETSNKIPDDKVCDKILLYFIYYKLRKKIVLTTFSKFPE